VNQIQNVNFISTNNHTAVIAALIPKTDSMSISTSFLSRGMYGGAAVNEIVLFPSTLTDTERTTLETNQIEKYLVFLITTQPSSSNQSVTVGGTPTNLSITSGASGATFQWYSNTTPSNTGGTLLSGETNSTLIPNTTTEGTLYYYVVVSNSLGTGPSSVSGYVRVGIEITTQPSTTPQSVEQGATLTPLSVVATGSNLTYQWYKNTTNSNTSGTLISGANASTYTPLSTDLGTLYYYVIISVTNTALTSSVSGSIKTRVISPNITYSVGTQNYNVNSAITPLVVSNSGGAITAIGIVTTLAGGNLGSLDGTGTAASFNSPIGITVDANGTLYVADVRNNRIRKITSSGVVITLAGGYSGNFDGTGTAAKFAYPTGITVDANGNLYVTDRYNFSIRKITSSGVVTTLAGGGYSGNLNGTGTAASFKNPTGITVDANGNLYVADQYDYSIRKITSSGVVTTLAGGRNGNLDGTGTAASFNEPTGITIDANGNLYVTDSSNYSIRKITSSGVVTTLAGGSYGNLDGTGTTAKFAYPKGITVDANGNLYVVDQYNSNIRKITSDGAVTTIAGGTRGSSNGIGTAAKFNNPAEITVDATGNLYVTDKDNNRIRKITQNPYQISPALPNGLSLNLYTGEISGTPTVASPLTTYTITATNESGSSSTTVAISTFLTAPTISNFSNVTKIYYDGTYTITPPTSNGSGAFTYASSDTNVATISGSTVTLVGAGTATITATQAADATYSSGATTATLTVNSVTVLTNNGKNTSTDTNYVNRFGVINSSEGLGSNGEIIIAKTVYTFTIPFNTYFDFETGTTCTSSMCTMDPSEVYDLKFAAGGPPIRARMWWNEQYADMALVYNKEFGQLNATDIGNYYYCDYVGDGNATCINVDTPPINFIGIYKTYSNNYYAVKYISEDSSGVTFQYRKLN
jgi:streptogramin lyase